jgi:hypothetical protein
MLEFITASIPSVIPLADVRELFKLPLASLSEKKASVQIALSEARINAPV